MQIMSSGSEAQTCLMCLSEYRHTQALHLTEKLKIFETSSEFLKVKKPNRSLPWWNFREDGLPFCSLCLFSAQLLSDLKSQLDSIQSSIKRIVARMKLEILNSESKPSVTRVRLERENYFRTQAVTDLQPVLKLSHVSNIKQSQTITAPGPRKKKNLGLQNNLEAEPDPVLPQNTRILGYDDSIIMPDRNIKIEDDYDWENDNRSEISFQDDLMESMTDSPIPISLAVVGMKTEDASPIVINDVYSNSNRDTSTPTTVERARKSLTSTVSRTSAASRRKTTRSNSVAANLDQEDSETFLISEFSPNQARKRKREEFTKIALSNEELNTYENYSRKTAAIRTPDGREIFHGFELLELEPGKFQCVECTGNHYFRTKYNLVQHIKFKHLGMTREKELMLKREKLKNVKLQRQKLRMLHLNQKSKNTVTVTHNYNFKSKRPLNSIRRNKKPKVAKHEQHPLGPDGPDPVSKHKRAKIRVNPNEAGLSAEEVTAYNQCSLRFGLVKTPDGKEMLAGYELKKLDDTKYECVICSNIFNNKYNLSLHIKFSHLGFSRKKSQMIRDLKPIKPYPKVLKDADGKLTVGGIEMRQLEDGIWSCGQCEHQVKKKYNMAIHIKSIHLGIKIKVFRNSKVFQGPKTLKQLTMGKTVISEDGKRLYEGVEVIPVEGTTDQFKCGACSVVFNSSGGVLSHIKKRHLAKDSPKLIPCTTCGKKFAYLHLLRDHEAVHGELPLHICEHCGLRFRHRAGLFDHTARIHDQVRKHKCDYCEKSFYTKKDCRIHTRTHTRERTAAGE